ncbi:hypothetical protein D3C87_1622850 [compost metagenome]
MQEIASGDNHIVVSGFHCKPGGKPHRLFQASAHPVSLDGIAVFLGDGEADAGFALRIVAVEHFEEKQGASTAFSCPNGQKLRTAFQPPDSRFVFI